MRKVKNCLWIKIYQSIKSQQNHVSLLNTNFPLQLCVNCRHLLGLGCEPESNYPSQCWTPLDLDLCRSCACCHTLREFIHALVLLCQVNTVSLVSSSFLPPTLHSPLCSKGRTLLPLRMYVENTSASVYYLVFNICVSSCLWHWCTHKIY